MGVYNHFGVQQPRLAPCSSDILFHTTSEVAPIVASDYDTVDTQQFKGDKQNYLKYVHIMHKLRASGI